MPAIHHLDRRTDRRTLKLTSQHKREMYILHLALKTTRGWYFTHTLPRPQRGDRFEFCLRGVIVDVITHAKYFVNRMRGLGVRIPKIEILPCYAVMVKIGRALSEIIGWLCPCLQLFHKSTKTRNSWQSLAYSPLGAAVSPFSRY